MSTDNIITCPNCGTKNRVPVGAKGSPVCNSCWTQLRGKSSPPPVPQSAVRASPQPPPHSKPSERKGIGCVWWSVALLGIGGCIWSNNSTSNSPSRSSTPSPSYASPSRPAPSPKPSGPPLVAVETPAHGTYSNLTGREAVAPFKITTSSSGYYYVKLVDSRTNEMAVVVFVHGGRPLEVDVPVGTYRMLYATGSTWYGPEHYFGPDTAYSKADTIFEFYIQGNYYSGNQVTLYRVRDGNMRTSSISKDQF